MPDIDIARLIIDHWIIFTPEEQTQIKQRIHDLVLLSLSQALDDAVTPSTRVQTFGMGAEPVQTATPLVAHGVAAEVPFGGPGQEPDYTYDDFAKLAEANGVPPTAAVGHWFGKSHGVEFDHSTPQQRREIYAEMVAFYSNQRDAGPNPVFSGPARAQMPPMAIVQPAYVQPNLQVCPQCARPAKYKAAGISQRTQKPYTAFYACQNGCKSQYNGIQKDQTWTTERDWTAAYNRTHAA